MKDHGWAECKSCKVSFKKKRYNQSFCSVEHQTEANNKAHRKYPNGKEVKCVFCGNVFHAKSNGKYCKKECALLSRANANRDRYSVDIEHRTKLQKRSRDRTHSLAGQVYLQSEARKKTAAVYRKSDKGKTANKKYIATEAGRQGSSEIQRRQREKFPERTVACHAVERFPKGGCVINNCDVDGQKHHYSYSRPKNIVYLCPQHHTDLHRGNMPRSQLDVVRKFVPEGWPLVETKKAFLPK